jgi:hypothetical protein
MVYRRSEIHWKAREVQLWDAIPTTFINSDKALVNKEVVLGKKNLFVLNNEPNQQAKMDFPTDDNGRIFMAGADGLKIERKTCVDVYDFNDFYGISVQDPDQLVNSKKSLWFEVNQVYGELGVTKVSLGGLIGQVDPGVNLMLWVIVAGGVVLAAAALVGYLWWRKNKKGKMGESAYSRVHSNSTCTI